LLPASLLDMHAAVPPTTGMAKVTCSCW
jgi:hypothetical protein